MRILCLLFPRLPLDLALRVRPGLRPGPVALLRGAGAGANVTIVSCELSARGIVAGMSAGEVSRRAPGTLFLPDNAGACFEALERVAGLLRRKATPFLEVGGRTHVFADLTRLAHGPVEEERVARALAALVTTWLESPARAGVADTRAAALEAARAARRAPQVVPGSLEEEPAIAAWPPGSVRVAADCRPGAGAPGFAATVDRLARKLDLVLAGRGATARVLSLRAGAWGNSLRLQEPEDVPSRHVAALLRGLPAGWRTERVELEADALGPLVQAPASTKRSPVLALAS